MESLGDVAGAVAEGDELHHLDLARGELVEWRAGVERGRHRGCEAAEIGLRDESLGAGTDEQSGVAGLERSAHDDDGGAGAKVLDRRDGGGEIQTGKEMLDEHDVGLEITHRRRELVSRLDAFYCDLHSRSPQL